MSRLLPELPKGGWRNVVFKTVVTSTIISLLAIFGTLLANHIAGKESLPVDYYASIALACVFTVPLFGFLMIKLQQLKLANQKLHYCAITDFLTGGLNRRAFMTGVQTRLDEHMQLPHVIESALLVIDVDHFKTINDRFGHQAGDLALVRIADALTANLRDTDLFGRLGGEEFGVYLDDIPHDAAIQLAERCRIAVSKCRFTPEDEEYRISVSIGIAVSLPGEDFISLFKRADGQLYAAKAHGRNRIETAGVSRAA
jgi:diguanylate cyclase